MGTVLDEAQALEISTRRQAAGERAVFTNGVFDLLHLGHLRYLCEAQALGDFLLVAVNADASTHALKGAGRPYVPEAERAELLAGLTCVDYVTIFPDATASRLLQALRPAIYVKGADYAGPDATTRAATRVIAPDDLRRLVAGESAASPDLAGLADRLPEAQTVAAYGGALALIAYLPDHSTSRLIARIRADASTQD